MNTKLLTSSEAARHLGISRQRTYQLIKSGHLRPSRACNVSVPLFTLSELARYVAARAKRGRNSVLDNVKEKE